MKGLRLGDGWGRPFCGSLVSLGPGEAGRFCGADVGGGAEAVAVPRHMTIFMDCLRLQQRKIRILVKR